MVWQRCRGCVLIVGAALRSVEAEAEEDAATCASPASVLWHVSIPRALPAVAVAALWIATIVLTEISVTDFFQVRTFAEEVYTQAALGSFGYVFGQASPGTLDPLPAIGFWSGLLLSAAFAGMVIVGVRRLFADWNGCVESRPVDLATARGSLAGGGIVGCVHGALLAGVPLANLAYKAGILVTSTDAGRVRSWSAAKLVGRVAAAPWEFRGELWFRLGWEPRLRPRR